MDTPSKHLLSNSGDDLNQSTMSHGTSFGESSFAADDSQFSSNHGTLRSSFDKESSKSGASSSRPPPAKTPQKKNVLELFPWLNDIEKSTQKCLGSINEVKSRTVLNAMDFLIRKLAEDYQKYCKSPRLSIILARYLREFLYSYRHLYKGFDLGKEYFRRVTKILAAYTDLELCGSVSGLEWDTEMANRIQLIYRIHLEFAEDFTVLDIFINMKRLSRVHRGVLTLLLKHFLVKITVKEPVEVEDDVFVKYLIVFKKWLAIEDIYEDKEDIRSAFTTQAKPKSTLCMNSKYAPYLPADEDGSTITNKYVRMLDKKFSFQPLLRALEVTEKVSGEPSTSGVARKINEVVVLSDDEEDASELQLVTVKTEISENSDNLSVIDQTSKPDLIDLTDEAFEDADVPRHYISWLTDLIKRAKVVPTTMDQRLEGASISHDVIVIDDPEENSEANKNPTDESQTTKIAPVNVSTVSTNVTHTNSPSMDSGCVLSNREEVGIHWNSNFEMCPSSQNEVRVDGTPADNQLCQPEQASHGNVVITNHSNDDNSMECNAFNVSSSDGNNRSLPINVVASGSISSCSDEAAEQLLTVALKNQKLNDRLPTSDLIDKVQMTKDSTSNRSINNKVSEPSDVDCTVESTSLSLEPTSSDSLPQPSHIPEPSTVCRRLQVVSDKNLTVNFDKKHVDDEISRSEDSGVASESVSGGGEPLDDYNAKVIRSQAKKSVTVVHPTRHKPHNTIDSETGDDFPQDMTSLSSSSSQKHFECSIPLSSIKTNNLFAKTVDNRSPTRATQHVIVESTADNSQAVANATSLSRRRIGEKTEIVNDNEHVPSTIMERKTYIKKTYNNKTISTGNRSLTTTKPPTQLTKSPTSSSSSSSLTIESRQQQVAITPHATSEQQHISPSKTTQTQHQPYKLFYSDEELPFLTPYDVFLNEKEIKQEKSAGPSSKSTQSTAVQITSKDHQKIAERNLSYDFSDEKLLTAAAQLVDVYNKRSKASATITVQKKPSIEPRNRNLNLNKQPIRPPFIVPNFVVTKITEKNRTPEKSMVVRQPPKSSHGVNIVKAIQKQEEIEQTKRMVEMQRQKSLHIFNANEDRKPSRVLFDANDFRMKSLSVANKITDSANTSERIKSTTIKPKIFGAVETNKPNQNEPVILNFRTKMHDPTSKPRQFDTPTTTNRKTNVNTYRVLEISPLSKNSMDRSIAKTIADRYYSNKMHSSSIAKSVRPISMPVTKVYSRFNANSSRAPYQNRTLFHRTRAPVVKKCPSLPDLSKVDKVQTDFLGQKTADETATSKISTTTTLTRSKSCFVCGTKSSANLFDQTIKSNEEYSKLYNICSDVVSKLCFKGQTIRRKRGRPKKKVYNSLTKDLLGSAEFSLKADILRLNEMYYASKRFDGRNILNANPRRSKRFALLSIEPVLPDLEPLFNRSRDRSPVNSFHINRAPLKTYSRANLIQPRVILDNKKFQTPTYTSKPQIQLLNIEPLSSTSQIDLEDSIKDEVTQSTEYIIDTGLSSDDLDESDAVYIEYLEDNDEIESPAYEPHVSVAEPDIKSPSIITEEADTTVESGSQWDQYRRKKSLDITHTMNANVSLNVKRSPNIEIKILKTSESDAHSTTDSTTELFTVYEVEDKLQFMAASSSPQKKPDVIISPVRKSTRKRKIPSEFPNFAKKIRG
ncbi:uncharacterized protein LOC129579209 isoform X1 [Sitodiplosis mosellana]|uniref:uncharacterized protein LOC129579209 isoform X1 n=1 Tax=Sitodiplosis mosellana TaxID=263140 RepID=UPI002443E2B1|nr:uncharacterized protein LOC129579209 isoform X1 [Sitodiplosis mosellana]XP_055325012.1 uncharacterized protein LOC129579209 isoform X1 [Sitodiplosis mosellana]